MKAKKVTAIIEASSTGFGVYVEDDAIPLTGYGKTVALAQQDMTDQLEELVASYQQCGEAVPIALNNGHLTFVYRYDLESIFKHFGMLDATNLARRIGMNPSLLRQYKTGATTASEKQKKKIEAGLHELGRELLNVRL